MAQNSMTPSEFKQFCKAVKLRLVEFVTKTVIPNTSPTNDDRLPIIKKRIVVESVPETWASRLTSDKHVIDGEEKVHCIMVGYGGVEKRPDQTTRSVAYNLRYTMRHYLYDYIGDEENNAEELQSSEVNAIVHTFLTTRPFGVPPVKEISELRERRGLSKMGTILVRESLCEILIEIDPITIIYPPT